MDQKKHDLVELMGTTMEKIRDMVDVNTIVGEAINTPDGTTVIPISRLSFGFGAGGGDFGKELKKFSGGSGAGVNINPIGFLIIGKSGVKMLPVDTGEDEAADRVVNAAMKLLGKLEEYIAERKKKKEEQEADF